MGIAGTTTDRADGLATARVPFVDLKIQAVKLRAELDAAFTSLTERAAYTMGPEIAHYEEGFAAPCGCSHAVGVRVRMRELGVESGVHYAVPLYLQPAYAGLGYSPGLPSSVPTWSRAWTRRD